MSDPQFRAIHLRSIEFILIGVMLSALFLALPLQAKLVVDFNPNLDFSRYKTYAFIGGVENLVAIQLNPELIENPLHHTVARELDKRGLREVQHGENPDLVVRYWINSSTQLDVALAGDWGPYAAYVGGYWSFLFESVGTGGKKESVLIIDLIDPKAKNLAWRLYFIGKLANPEKEWKRIDEEVSKGLDSYPPSDKAKEDKKQEQAAHPPKSQ
ncbi:MAG TPA: DUF4136 domain-containing protein [Verrucomicrobiae bacterium]|nr:DUF4136 domain-containing protein [Verrucomicrobiae bacterium]